MGGSGRTVAANGVGEDHDQPRRQKTSFDRLRLENSGGCGSGVFIGTIFPKHSVYDKMYILLQDDTGSSPALSHGASGIDMRNLMVVIGNTPQGAGGYKYAVGYRDPSGTVHSSLSSYSNRVYGCTFVDLRADDKDPEFAMLKDDGPFDFELSANIRITPNQTASSADYSVADAPMDDTVGWTPTMVNFYNEGNVPDSSKPAPDTTRNIPFAALFKPESTSAAYRGADTSERIPVDDFFGNLRFGPGRPTPTRGAIEPG
ncbi:hypothetical protein [Primorskyibacter sedentarius]|uniref:hypothetical protein n=1 Tax=Primorskyibacter sedentarius TaxID=745311 RepID=UPI003EBF0578